MPLAIVYSRANVGVDAPLVRVETHLANGLPAFSIVGLPETSVREARDRVRSAIQNSGYEFPAKRITVNLAPADLPKDGGRFDLAIAVGILCGSGLIPQEQLNAHEFIGELSLSGAVRPVHGALPAALHCAKAGRALILPAEDAASAALSKTTRLLAAESLLAVTAHLNAAEPLPAVKPFEAGAQISYPDMADVAGQQLAKNGLLIAAAGAHNILLCGPPGTGKTLLASRLPGLLPPLSESEMLESMAVYSAAGIAVDPRRCLLRPFRNPHHSASLVALTGGGSHPPGPGEISLAHCGVLFLDELAEYPRRVLDSLRQPLEAGEIIISRARGKLRFPARFQLIAAMNPCPCGYYGDPMHDCECTPDQIRRYRSKLSGPLLDRIDLRIDVPRLAPGELANSSCGKSSTELKKQVQACRELQVARQGCANQALDLQGIRQFCSLSPPLQTLLNNAVQRLGLSGRAQHRIQRTARTIADLAEHDAIADTHLLQALNFRGSEI